MSHLSYPWRERKGTLYSILSFIWACSHLFLQLHHNIMSTSVEQQRENMPTPLIPNGGVFSVSSSVVISASASRIFSTIVDTANWHKWNTFVPRVEILKQPSGHSDSAEKLGIGTDMRFQVFMKPGGSATSSLEQVTVLDPAAGKICWKFTGTPSWLLRSERVHEITDKDDGTCEYRTWETFAGPIAYIIRLIYGNVLQERFKDWGRDLKRYVEEAWGLSEYWHRIRSF